MGLAVIRVPASYIKQDKVDYDGELFAVFDRPLRLGSLLIPPPPLGVFSLLEIIESKFYSAPLECTAEDIAQAIVIATRREQAVELIEAWKAGDREPLRLATVKLMLEHGEDIVSDLYALATHLLQLPLSGFRMIPSGGGGYPSEYIYGADTIASISSLLCSKLNMSLFDAMWRCPMCLAGHLTAQEAKNNGKEGVSRPKDRADVKKQIALAYEREQRGELHPWQIKYPDLHKPTALQKAVNPEIVVTHAKLLRAMAQKVKSKK